MSKYLFCILISLATFSSYASDLVEVKLDEIFINGVQHDADDLKLNPGDEVQLILYSTTGKVRKKNPPRIHFVYLDKDGVHQSVKKLYYNDDKTECGKNPSGKGGWGCRWSFSVNNHRLKGGKYIFSVWNKWASDNGYVNAVEFDTKNALPGDSYIVFSADEYIPSTELGYLENPMGDTYVGKGVAKIMVGKREINIPYAVNQDGYRLQGDMILGHEGDQPFFNPLGIGMSLSERMWPNNTVIYDYTNEVEDSRTAKANYEAAMAALSKVTYIKFKRRTSETKGYVEFRLKPGVCQANVGYDKNKITIVQVDEYGCGEPEITHELVHTVGGLHEQTRHDRETYIEVLQNNITDEMLHNFAVIKKDITFGGTVYDRRSLMHYGGCGMAKDYAGCVEHYNDADRRDYITIDWIEEGSDFRLPYHQTSQVKTLSAGDIALLKKMYPSTPKPCIGCNCPTPEPEPEPEPEPCKGCNCS